MKRNVAKETLKLTNLLTINKTHSLWWQHLYFLWRNFILPLIRNSLRKVNTAIQLGPQTYHLPHMMCRHPVFSGQYLLELLWGTWSDTNSSGWSLKNTSVDYRLGFSWGFYGFGFQVLGFFLRSAGMKWVWTEQSNSQDLKTAVESCISGLQWWAVTDPHAARADSSVWGRMGTFCEQKTEDVW